MSQRGFSLIELLMAMAVMLAVAAIAVPHLVNARMSANEAAALGNVRQLQNAQMLFSIGHPDEGFSCSLSELGPSLDGKASASNADLIDSQLTSGKKSGYIFGISGCSESLPRSAYTITAEPESNGRTGKLYFCAHEDGQLFYSADSATSCVAHGIRLSPDKVPNEQRATPGSGSDLASAASTPASN